jgi:hypothetical protein
MGDPIFLVGDAREVGHTQGELQRAFLQERIGRVVACAGDLSGASDVLLKERADKFGEVLAASCPHWLEEASGLASGAGVEAWQVLALNCLPKNFWGDKYAPAPLVEKDIARAKAETEEELINAYDAQGIDLVTGGGDCTTFFALPESTLAGETLFHKNREEKDEVQCLYIKQLQKMQRFVGGGEVGNLGTAHLHTENFWCGANNTGSCVPSAEYMDCALSDSHALRYLAERCAGLDEIVPALHELIARQHLGGGAPEAGMILIFADASRGLIVEATSRRLHAEYFEGDAMAVRTNHFLFPEMQKYALAPHPGSMARYNRACRLWEEERGFASIPACGEIARDRENAPHAICRNPSDKLNGSVTVSTSTATISPHDDRRSQTHFRNCHPAYTPAIILTPLDRVCDSELLSGAHNQYWRNYRGWV